MFSISNSRIQTVLFALISLVIATGLWYIVVGRDHVETQVELRVEYRGLPDGLIIREGMVNHISVRVRGSAELLRYLHSRDLFYTVDLSAVQRGATALPLAVDSIPEFKAFEILEIMPNRLVLEADALTERVVPLEHKLLPLPEDSPYLISHPILEPSFVTVKGPETQVNSMERLVVVYNPAKNASEGPHEANVAIVAPPQVEVTPPVTTLRYALEVKTTNVTLTRDILLDSENSRYNVSPGIATVEISVPEALAEDKDYLDAVRVIVREPASLPQGDSVEIPPIVMLPSDATLVSIKPSAAVLSLKEEADQAWTPAESIFSMPSSIFGMDLPEQHVTEEFSLNDIPLPSDVFQPDDFKVQAIMPGERLPGEEAAGTKLNNASGEGDPSSAADGQSVSTDLQKQAPEQTQSASQEHQKEQE